MSNLAKWTAAVALFAAAGLAGAQERKDDAGRNDDKNKYIYRVSSLTGMDVRNSKNEDLGEVSDFVLRSDKGEVVYAVLSYGGTLGVGSKYFAVPLNALSIKEDPKDRGDYYFHLEVTKASLDNGRGFNKDSYPTTADQIFMGRNDGDKNAPPAAGGDRPAAGGDRPAAGADDRKQIRSARSLMGMRVRSAKGERLGRLSDIVINPGTGKVAYGIVSYGGVLGVGDKLFAVAWGAMPIKALEGDPNNSTFVLNVDKATFDNSPGFDKNTLPAAAGNWGRPAGTEKNAPDRPENK